MPTSFFNSAMIVTFSAGSPGPLESINPTGFFASISSAVALALTISISKPRAKSFRTIFSFAPKSQSTTFLPFPTLASRSF